MPLSALLMAGSAVASATWTDEWAGEGQRDRMVRVLEQRSDGRLLGRTFGGGSTDPVHDVILTRDGRLLEARVDVADNSQTHASPGGGWARFTKFAKPYEYRSGLFFFTSSVCALDRQGLGGLPYFRFNDLAHVDSGGTLDGANGHLQAMPHNNMFFPPKPAYVARYGADCGTGVAFEVAPLAVRELRNDPGSAGGYLLEDSAGLALRRIDADGLRWTRPLDASTSLVHVSAAGDAYLLAGRKVRVFDREGNERWSRTFLGDVSIDSDAAHVFARSTTETSEALLESIDRDGNVRWRHVSERRLEPVRLQPGEPLAWRMDAGAPTPRIAVATDTGLEVKLLEDGFITIGRLEDGRWHVDKGVAGLLDAGGTNFVPLTVSLRQSRTVLSQSMDAQGALVLTGEPDGSRSLRAWAPDGVVRWTARLPAVNPSGTDTGTVWLSANAARACVLHSTGRLTCFARASGARMHDWVRAVNAEFMGVRFLSLDEAGTNLVAIGCCHENVQVLRVGNSGEVLTVSTIGTGAALDEIVVGSGGDYGVKIRKGQASELAVFDRMHGARFRLPATANAKVLAITADGGALVVDGKQLSSRSPEGTVRWSFILPYPSEGYAIATSGAALASGDFLVEATVDSFGFDRRLWRFRGDGSVAWTRDEHQDASWTDLRGWLVSRDETRAWRMSNGVLYWDTNSRRRLQLDTSTGSFVAAFVFPEVTRGSDSGTVAIDADGRVLRVRRDKDGEVLHVDGGTLPAESSGTPFTAQILGSWQARDSSGQGLFFDADANGVAFGAWFTYARRGGHHPSALSWYTLAAAPAPVPAGKFVVYRSRAGRFAQLPLSSAAIVGEATLKPLGCDEAQLHYRLTLDGAVEESIVPLRRATPGTRTCTGGAGIAAVARNGLDPRSSGAWHDPSLSGQGIAFDLRPPGPQQPGFFAGAWFTFDPAGAMDDADAQHWFTLAGALTDSMQGSVTVPIYRTIGGRFDVGYTNNTWQIGTVRIEFTACDRATLDYEFGTMEQAHAFSGLRGRQNLVRIGGCGD